MKQKKIYKSPTVKSVELNTDSILNNGSLGKYDEEAPFVGARRRADYYLEEGFEDDFEFEK